MGLRPFAHSRSRAQANAIAVLVLALFVCLGVAGLAGVGSADPGSSGEPDIEVFVPEAQVDAGSDQIVTVQVVNDAHPEDRGDPEDILVARSVSIDVTDAGPFAVTTAEQSIGTLEPGVVQPVEIGIRVPDDLDPGEYEMELTIEYTSLSSDDEDIAESHEETEDVSIEVIDTPRFAISTVESHAQIGGQGPVTIELENVGTETAQDVSLTLTAESPVVGLGGPENLSSMDAAAVAELGPDETETFTFDVSLSRAATDRSYGLDGLVRYSNQDGIGSVDERPATSFTPLAEQSFDIDVIDSTLRPGESGSIEVAVVNEGPLAVENVALVLEEAHFIPRSASVAVGHLAPDESANVTLRGTVPSEADSVPQRMQIHTQYRTIEGIDQSSVEAIHVPVAERRDAISAVPIDAEFGSGEDGPMNVTIENNRDVELREIRLTVLPEDPIESDFPMTSLPELAAGESDVVTFHLDIDADAPTSSYPLLLEIEYIDEYGEIQHVRPVSMTISVTEEPADIFDGIEVIIFALLILMVIGAMVWLYWR